MFYTIILIETLIDSQNYLDQNGTVLWHRRAEEARTINAVSTLFLLEQWTNLELASALHRAGIGNEAPCIRKKSFVSTSLKPSFALT